MTVRAADSNADLGLSRGSLYLSVEYYTRYFNGLGSVILVNRDKQLLVMPVHNEASGGLLMKIRNARGDRIIHAQEFLAFHGLENVDEEVQGKWDTELSALVLNCPI
ncbi:MAG: hypothetical protein JKY88_16405 [Pseudomonadales bacterium]|nr:hypothetical protein [Pseudomonadales bacterium]